MIGAHPCANVVWRDLRGEGLIERKRGEAKPFRAGIGKGFTRILYRMTAAGLARRAWALDRFGGATGAASGERPPTGVCGAPNENGAP
jgi:hypothetical protein